MVRLSHFPLSGPAIAAMISASIILGPSFAADHPVSGDDELREALRTARAGDSVLLAAGTYRGDIYAQGLEGITIRSAEPANPAIIEGGRRGLQLVDPVNVTIEALVFTGQREGGIIIDDGETPETPARNIILRDVVVRGIKNRGNHDGIKLAGVTDVVIEGVEVEDWGDGGSAIDFVGVHNALIQNSLIRHKSVSVAGSGIRVKGGSRAIVIRANRIELPAGRGRAIQAGGQTDTRFFRFADGDSGYEARDVRMEGNVIIGGGSAISWVNIDGGIAHRNLIHRPGRWVLRILNENPGLAMVATRNGRFHDNRVVYNVSPSELRDAVNIGDGTQAETFHFARNSWFNLARPNADGSRPRLPSAEAGGVYGAAPAPDPNEVQSWEMPWGAWLINAAGKPVTLDLSANPGLRLATPGDGAIFDPLGASPLGGAWKVEDAGAMLELQPMSQAILLAPSVSNGNQSEAAQSGAQSRDDPASPAAAADRNQAKGPVEPEAPTGDASTTGTDGRAGLMPKTGEAPLPAREAFAASKELNTVAGWRAFLAAYPDGFLADLARAHIKKLQGH